jgi:hypothetical protein
LFAAGMSACFFRFECVRLMLLYTLSLFSGFLAFSGSTLAKMVYSDFGLTSTF